MALRHRLGWDAAFMQRSRWFWPLEAAAAHFTACSDWPARSAYDAAYRALAPHAEPLRFAENVKREELHDGTGFVLDRLYDGRITERGEVPTRERDWHDFFNALCFMTFPRAKRALHRRQFGLLARRIEPGATRLPPARTPEQDALTLFDEGGAAVVAEPPEYQQLMAASETGRVDVITERIADSRVRIVPFGHALFEHLVEGLRCPGGSTRILQCDSVAVSDAALLAEVDRQLAVSLANPSHFLTPRESAHVRLDALDLR